MNEWERERERERERESHTCFQNISYVKLQARNGTAVHFVVFAKAWHLKYQAGRNLKCTERTLAQPNALTTFVRTVWRTRQFTNSTCWYYCLAHRTTHRQPILAYCLQAGQFTDNTSAYCLAHRTTHWWHKLVCSLLVCCPTHRMIYRLHILVCCPVRITIHWLHMLVCCPTHILIHWLHRLVCCPTHWFTDYMC